MEIFISIFNMYDTFVLYLYLISFK